MNISIREHSKDDLPYIRASVEKLHDYVVSTDQIKRIRKMPGLIDGMYEEMLSKLETNQGKIYVGSKDGKRVGFVAGFVGDKQSNDNLLEVIPSKSGVVSDIFVGEEYRGKGVGSQLMQKIESYLVSKGCDAIWVSTNSFNKGAVELYRSLGFEEREVEMMKKVGV